jgi:chromate transporter
VPTPDPDHGQAAARRPPRPLGEVLVVMGKLGTIAFGGPAVHVAMLREETVRRRHWLQDAEFLDLFGAVSVLPGPSSTQLAIVLARRRAGWAGLLVGGACFILPAMAIVATAAIFAPSFVLVAALEPLIGRIRSSPWAGAALDGITMAALGLMAGVTVDLGRTAITDPLTAVVAVVALLVVLRWRPNTAWLVLAGAAIGIAHALA